jgi:hypothetical protein
MTMERLLEYDTSRRGLRDPLPEDEWEGCEPVMGVPDQGAFVACPQSLTGWFIELPF